MSSDQKLMDEISSSLISLLVRVSVIEDVLVEKGIVTNEILDEKISATMKKIFNSEEFAKAMKDFVHNGSKPKDKISN